MSITDCSSFTNILQHQIYSLTYRYMCVCMTYLCRNIVLICTQTKIILKIITFTVIEKIQSPKSELSCVVPSFHSAKRLFVNEREVLILLLTFINRYHTREGHRFEFGKYSLKTCVETFVHSCTCASYFFFLLLLY